MTTLHKVVIGVAVVFAAIACVLGYAALSVATSGPSAGNSDPVQQIQTWFVNGIKHGTALNGQPVTDNWAQTQIALGQNQAAWHNTTGKTVYVDLGSITTVGTASSTFRVYAISTTSATIPASQWATAVVASNTALINGITYATSTTATTTNSVMAAVVGKGIGVLPVPEGSYFTTYIQSVDSAGCQTSKACEQATSSNRGISTLTTRFHYSF